jgi:hypothetical protein
MNVYFPRNMNSQHQSYFLYYAALAVGVGLIALSLYLWVPEHAYGILASAFMVLGVSYTLLASRQSSRDFSFFIPIIVVVLTIGIGIFVEVAIVIGFLGIAESLTYYKSRVSSRPASFFVKIGLGILIGSVLLIVLSFLGFSNLLLGIFLLLSIIGLMEVDL